MTSAAMERDGCDQQEVPVLRRRTAGQTCEQVRADVQLLVMLPGNLLHAVAPWLKVKLLPADARPCPHEGHT